MSNALNCSSCGGSNQLPEGKTSMFCSFCGNAIEQESTKNNSTVKVEWPKIEKSEKKEIPFDEMQWKELQKMAFSDPAIRSITGKILKTFEHKRTNEGYNVRIIFQKLIGTNFYDEKGEWEFVPFEYDIENFTSKLSLQNKGIKSLNELFNNYESNELREITHLDLSNNKIADYSGIEKFTSLKFLNLSDNALNQFPTHWPQCYDEEIEVECYIIEELNLSNNKIKTIPNNYPFPRYTNVLIKGNPLENLPSKVKMLAEDEWLLSISIEGLIELNETDELKVKREQEENKDFRNCDKCGKKIIKRTFEENNGNCTSCNKGKCFIATATMGSYDHPEVMELRHFRDEWILTKNWGANFVQWYYHYGEKAAKVIDKSFILKKLSYLLIVKPLVHLSRIVKSKING